MSVPVIEEGAVHSDQGLWWESLDQEATPELRWPKSIKVYARMRREEAQVASVLRAVKMPVRRTPRRIDGTGCRPEVVALVAQDLGLPVVGEKDQAPARTRDRFNFGEHLRLSLTSLDYGHAVFEQLYRPVDGRFRLRKLGWRPPSTVGKFDEARDGGLKAVEQSIAGGIVRLNINRLVVYSNEREETWVGNSLLRPAYKYWLLKDQLLRLQQQTIDRNGMGVPTVTAPSLPEELVATYDEWKAATAEQIKYGLQLATQLRAGQSSGVSLANGAMLALKGVEGKLPDPLPVIKYFDEQMARAVLAHFLNLGTETGSWALGTTFADFFTQSLQAVSDYVDETINSHIIEDLVDVNFGQDEPAPRLVSDRIGAALAAESLKQLVDAGVITPDEPLENYVRQEYGLPVADPATARTHTEESPHAA